MPRVFLPHDRAVRAGLLLCALAVCCCGRAQDTTRLSLLFFGDMMQHDSQLASARLSDTTFDYRPSLRWLAPRLHSADFAIGNLELTLAGPPYRGYPLFSAPDALARDLQQAGTDVLVTANNHSMDRGGQGLQRTLRVLQRQGLLHTGTFVDSLDRARRHPLWLEKNGLRVALLNYTYGTNGLAVPKPHIVNLIDTVRLKADLARARRGSPDMVVVFFHWGDEYQRQPNVWQRRLTALCFREGVNLVVGAHPHVLQPMVWHRNHNRLVAYSLGNFMSGQQQRYRDGGATLHVQLAKTAGRTTLVAAHHELHWVHRDPNGHYQLLPAEVFASDSLLLRAGSRQRLQQFVADTQALFEQEKQGVPAAPCGPEAVFRVWLSADSTVQDHALWRFFTPEQITCGGQTQWVAGTFHEASLAVQAAMEIAAKTPYTQAAVVRLCACL